MSGLLLSDVEVASNLNVKELKFPRNVGAEIKVSDATHSNLTGVRDRG